MCKTVYVSRKDLVCGNNYKRVKLRHLEVIADKFDVETVMVELWQRNESAN
jgi:hypothetical protein